MKVALDTLERTKANQFTTWSTEQLREWVEGSVLLPDILVEDIFDTYLQAVEELNLREGIYEELEMLY